MGVEAEEEAVSPHVAGAADCGVVGVGAGTDGAEGCWQPSWLG